MLTTLLLWVFPLRCLCPLGSPSFGVFPLHFSPLFLLWLPSFYSKLIQWDFSLLPLALHQMLFVVGILSRLPTHPLVAPTIAQYMFTTLLLISRQNSLFFCFCCMPLPHYPALWHALDGPNHLLLLLGKIPSQQDIVPKEVIAGNQI